MNKPGFPSKYLFKEVSEKTRLSNIRAGVCVHWGCNRPARTKGRDCETCKSRKARFKDPLKYAFRNIRRSAQGRNIPFLLTLDEFQDFCQRTGYLSKKGKEFEDLTIDRIDPSKPYQADNIRALTWIDNCSHLVENMTDPAEPIARALAKFACGNEDKFKAYLKEADRVLAQVEILQKTREKENEENPF
jgi:hypothetical protein